jgi:hypothetical protein
MASGSRPGSGADTRGDPGRVARALHANRKDPIDSLDRERRLEEARPPFLGPTSWRCADCEPSPFAPARLWRAVSMADPAQDAIIQMIARLDEVLTSP